MIALTGIDRLCVVNKIKIIKLQLNFGHFIINPNDEKDLQLLEYFVENNLPVDKDLLYRVVPEAFEYEIRDFHDVIKRKRDLARFMLQNVS